VRPGEQGEGVTADEAGVQAGFHRRRTSSAMKDELVGAHEHRRHHDGDEHGHDENAVVVDDGGRGHRGEQRHAAAEEALQVGAVLVGPDGAGVGTVVAPVESAAAEGTATADGDDPDVDDVKPAVGWKKKPKPTEPLLSNTLEIVEVPG